MSYQFGIVGLGVMGANLARNMAGHGVSVAGYDLTQARRAALLESAPAGRGMAALDTLGELAAVLAAPRRILIMTPAGASVDDVLASLRPHLHRGDVVLDGGNSHFADTERRCAELEDRGLAFLGMGISGGAAGALTGPAIMAGGTRAAWEEVAPVFRAIAARADDGEPCVGYVGPRGAGHYVKMVHNGLEYSEMQLIAEIYDVLRRGADVALLELAEMFAAWSREELHSYLLDITATILRQRDERGQPLVDAIRDEAEQKGTGRWMSVDASTLGVPIPTITAAVEARMLSMLGAQRRLASRVLPAASPADSGHQAQLADTARQALSASRITLYAQGFALLAAASERYGYGVDLAAVARIWRNGCIIRSALLPAIADAFRRDHGLANLLLDASLGAGAGSRQDAWRRFVQAAVGLGVPVPAMAASLAYYDAYRSERLPANLTQAQRDLFGRHGYRRVDSDGVFHARWGTGTADGPD